MSVVNSVLDDIEPPPGLNIQPKGKIFEQIVHNYKSYEPQVLINQHVKDNTDLFDIKKKLEDELILTESKLINIKNQLEYINDTIEIGEKMKILEIKKQTMFQNLLPPPPPAPVLTVPVLTSPVIEPTPILSINMLKPSPEFINEIYSLFSKEAQIPMSHIAHKLPDHVLPPKGIKGLLKSWLNQVPGLRCNLDENSGIPRYIYWLEYSYIKENSPEDLKPKNRFQCYQKNRGKPCKLVDGKCKFCK
jgi:hypothetical protein